MIFGSRGSKSRLAAEPHGKMIDEKLHAGVVPSMFGSQNVSKHPNDGPLLKVEMPKMSMPLWCEAHVRVKRVKN